ncbi:MAG TPA: exodeoxyribonuclease III [Anaerolineae bacterium]|jgi:exodeoxyribonuclease-3
MPTIKLLSWNVNGVRAVYKKGFLPWLEATAPDILCLQETKAEEAQLAAELAQPAGYQAFWNSAKRKRGYSGTALLTRQAPLSVQFGLGLEEFDQEGRTIVAEYPGFTLLNCYFPNGARDHSRVPFKLAFYDAFLAKCEQFRAEGRPVVFCGDVNTAHREIDLAHPKTNQNTTGFLPEERLWLDQVVEAGYVDTFRHVYPDLAEQYTWWSMPTKARERNIGWRLDYFFVAAELVDRLETAFILPEVMGSDHCPVGLRLRL